MDLDSYQVPHTPTRKTDPFLAHIDNPFADEHREHFADSSNEELEEDFVDNIGW